MKNVNANYFNQENRTDSREFIDEVLKNARTSVQRELPKLPIKRSILIRQASNENERTEDRRQDRSINVTLHSSKKIRDGNRSEIDFIPQIIHGLLLHAHNFYFKQSFSAEEIYSTLKPYLDSLRNYARILNSIKSPNSLIDCAIIAKKASQQPSRENSVFSYQDSVFSATKPLSGNQSKRIVIEMSSTRSVIGAHFYNL